MGSTYKVFLMHTEVRWCLKVNHLHDWVAIQTSSFLHRTPNFYSKEQLTNYVFFCVTEYLAAIISKIKWACHFKENNRQCFLPW